MAKLKDQIKNLSTFAKDTASLVVEGRPIKVSPEEATRRYHICLACPSFKDQKCILCGCNMGLKVRWEAAKCADKTHQKW